MSDHSAEQIVAVDWHWNDARHSDSAVISLAAQLVAARSLSSVTAIAVELRMIRRLLASVGEDGIHNIIAEHARRARETATRRRRKERQRTKAARATKGDRR